MASDITHNTWYMTVDASENKSKPHVLTRFVYTTSGYRRRLNLVLLGLHPFRRLCLRLLLPDVVPVGAQHRPGALLERLVHRPPRLLVCVFINLLKHRVQRRVPRQLILLLLLELPLQLVPVRDGFLLRRLTARVRRPGGRRRRDGLSGGRGAGCAAAPLGDVAPLRVLSLFKPHLQLGDPDGRLALRRKHLAEEFQVQHVRIRRVVLVRDADAHAVGVNLERRVVGPHVLCQHLQGDVREGLVPLVLVPGLGRGGGRGGNIDPGVFGLCGVGGSVLLRNSRLDRAQDQVVAFLDPLPVHLGPRAVQLCAPLEAHPRSLRLAELEERHAFT
mmetsp:Transcript_9144/g.37361  ORF Transcript_9144/g.37361 Transcript_9144/m.37361 type:complete len:331 (+) Transcript_9144:913-1905(+)